MLKREAVGEFNTLFSSHSALLRQQCSTLPALHIRNFVNTLTGEENAMHSDRWLCSLVRLQLIVDEALNTLHVTPAEEFDKPGTQHQLKMSQQRLQDWKECTPKELNSRESRSKFYTSFNHVLTRPDRPLGLLRSMRRSVHSSHCNSQLQSQSKHPLWWRTSLRPHVQGSTAIRNTCFHALQVH